MDTHDAHTPLPDLTLDDHLPFEADHDLLSTDTGSGLATDATALDASIEHGGESIGSTLEHDLSLVETPEKALLHGLDEAYVAGSDDLIRALNHEDAALHNLVGDPKDATPAPDAALEHRYTEEEAKTDALIAKLNTEEAALHDATAADNAAGAPAQAADAEAVHAPAESAAAPVAAASTTTSPDVAPAHDVAASASVPPAPPAGSTPPPPPPAAVVDAAPTSASDGSNAVTPSASTGADATATTSVSSSDATGSSSETPAAPGSVETPTIDGTSIDGAPVVEAPVDGVSSGESDPGSGQITDAGSNLTNDPPSPAAEDDPFPSGSGDPSVSSGQAEPAPVSADPAPVADPTPVAADPAPAPAADPATSSNTVTISDGIDPAFAGLINPPAAENVPVTETFPPVAGFNEPEPAPAASEDPASAISKSALDPQVNIGGLSPDGLPSDGLTTFASYDGGASTAAETDTLAGIIGGIEAAPNGTTTGDPGDPVGGESSDSGVDPNE